MEKRTVLQEVNYRMKPIKHLRIGDPSYFEELADENCDNAKALKSLTFDGNIRCCDVGEIVISEVQYDTEYGENKKPLSFTSIEVTICQGSRQEFVNIYKEGNHYKGTVRDERELACDTACFEIDIDGRFDEIDTGADGYYGYLWKFKEPYGAVLSLSLDGDLFSFEDVVKEFSYLCDFKENDLINKESKEDEMERE